MSNLGKFTDNMSTQSATALTKEYSAAIQGLTKDQATLALTMAKVDAEKQKEILNDAKLVGSTEMISASKVKQALAETALKKEQQKSLLTEAQLLESDGISIAMTKDKIIANIEETNTYKNLSFAKQKELISQIEKIAGNNAEKVSTDLLTESIKKQTKARLAAMATNPLTWIGLVIAGIVAFTKVYAKLTISANEAKEATANSITESQNQLKTIRDQKDNIDQLKESYEKLSKGVDTVTNENLTLSTDSYKEYLDVCNQIADIYPDLVVGYDAQGNAILSLKGNVEGLTDAYKEAQAAAYATAYLGTKDDKGKRTGGISSAKKEFQYATNTIDPGDNWWNRNAFTANQQLEDLKKLQNMSVEEFRQTGYAYSEIFRAVGMNINDLFDVSEGEFQTQVNYAIQTLEKNKTSAISDVRSAIEGYMKGITDASGTALKSGYDKLTEKQQSLATSLLSSLDEDKLQEFEDSGNFEEAEQAWVDKLVSSVSNMSFEAKNAYNDLQKSIANPGDLTSETIKSIDGDLDKLSLELDVDKDKLKEIFNLDDVFNTEDSFNKKIEEIFTSFDDTDIEDAYNTLDDYKSILQEAEDLGVDLNKTTFGNIDTNNRQILKWTDATLNQYKEALQTWDDEAKNDWNQYVNDNLGQYSTIYGGSDKYNGIEIAFSPMLQTDNGAVLLSKDTVDTYINSLMSELPYSWTDSDLFKLDAEGLDIDGQHIKNLIADIGDTATQTGEAMHFVGNTGAVEDAKKRVAEYNDILKESIDTTSSAEKTSEQYKKENEQASKTVDNNTKSIKTNTQAIKWMKDNCSKMTISQKKMFLEAANGADSALKIMQNYTDLVRENALNTLSIDIKTVTDHVTKLNTALSESASATGLTTDSITNLKNMFSGLDDYDASKLFENTANGIKVNRQELEKLNQEYDDQNMADAQNQLDVLKETYNDLTDQINSCSDASEAANLYAQRNAVLDQIDDVQSLISQYDGLMSAFNEWQNAQNETSPGANYDSMYSYIETANELAKDGKWGNPALEKYIELISGKDLSDATPKDMKVAWENLGTTIGNTGHNLMEFLTKDNSGMKAFVDTLDKLDKGYIKTGEDGQKILQIDSMQGLAEDLGTDVSYVQVLLDKLSEYGWKINVDSTDIELAKTNAESANDELKELGFTDYTFNFTARGDALTTEINKAEELLNDPRFKNAEGNFDINIKGASEARQILVALLAQREALQEPTIMQIDTDKLEGNNKTVISTLQELQSYIDGYEIDIEANMNTEEMTQGIDATINKIKDLNPEIQKQLGLADTEVQSAMQTLQQNIANGVKLDDTAKETLQKALENISPEILASLGIDMDQAKKDADEVAQSFETALTNVLSNMTITVDGKEIKFNIKQPDPVEVTADTSDANDKIDETQKNASNFAGTTFQSTVDANTTPANAAVQTTESLLTNYEDKPWMSTLYSNNTPANNEIDNTTSKMTAFTIANWHAGVSVNTDDTELNSTISKLTSYFVSTAKGVFTAAVKTSGLGYGIASIASKAFRSGNKNANSGGSNANGTFHGFASGTLNGFANGTNVSIPYNQNALVNEIGTEGILRDGVLHEIPGGAHIEPLRKGDIIFNNRQMEQLRENGYVTANGGHGRLIGGYAYGTLNGMHGYASPKKDDHSASGSGSFSGASVSYGNSKSESNSKSSGSSKSSSSSKSSGSKSSPSSKSSSDSSKEAEKTEETLDWNETKISRVKRLIQNLEKTVSATYRSWSDRNTALSQELSEVYSEISIQQQAYNRYIQQANSVGLDAGYAQLVRDGKIDIETITDEDLKQKIEDYKEWYNKALDCADAILDLKDNLYDLAKTNFDNITKQFEDQLDVIEHSVNMVEGYIDLAETRGYLASTDYYDSLIKLETQNIGTLKNEYDSLANTLNNLTNSGQIEKYSEAWYEMYSQICDVEESLQDATKALSEYESKLRELKWSYFEKEQDYITNFTDETQWLVDLLEKQGKLIDDNNGKITDRGTATMGLHAVGYNTYMAQADDYAKEIQKINQQLASDPYNTILIDKRQEYLKAQRDAIDNAYDEIDATKSLIKDGYDAQIDALEKLIEKRKDAMSAEKDLYDYQKSISQKVESLSSYEKQRIAYENDNSEEGMAKRQQLDKNIKDTKQDLQESEYEQWLDDQQKLLDTLYD